MPDIEELKYIMFSLRPYLAAGPHGINGRFFQAYWSVINNDLLAVAQAFYCGQMLPKYFTHACLVLLPKISCPSKLSEVIPIGLSNFVNKLISKLLFLRLALIFPDLISLN